MSNKLISKIKSLGISLRPGCSQVELSNLEEIVGYDLPPEFIQLYREADGYQDHHNFERQRLWSCLLYTSDAADD